MKDLRARFLKNFASFGSIDIISLLIPLITMPLLTRAVGVEGYGIYLFFTTILVFGQSFIDYSSNFNGVREYAFSQDYSKLFSSYQTLRYSLLFIYIAMALFFLSITGNDSITLIVFNSFIYLLAYSIIPNWYLIASNKVYIYAKIVLLSKVCFLLLVVIFVRDESDLPILFLSTSVPYLMITVFFIVISKQKIGLPRYTFCFFNAIKKFRTGFDTFIGVFSPNLYNNIPILILGGLINPALFSLFAIASRLCSLCIMVQNNAAKSIYPLIFEKKNEFILRNSIILNLVFSTIFCISILLVCYYGISYILGVEYEGVFLYLIIMVPSLFFTGINNSLSYIYLLPNGHDAEFRTVSLFVSVICCFIGLFLIYFYSAIGVAILISIARLFLCLGFVFMYFKLERLKQKVSFNDNL
jgi:O-antigen/teichoic acid export membrane protein